MRIPSESVSRVSDVHGISRMARDGAIRRTSRADMVNLSPRAQLILVARQALANVPAVRAERVEALQRLIATGRYEINAERCAAAMLGEGVSTDNGV